MSALFYLNKYLARYKWRLLLGSLFLLLKNIFQIETPLVVKDTINEIIRISEGGLTANLDSLMKLGLIAAGLYIIFSVISGFFLFLTRQTIIIMSRLIEYDLKNEIYRHYQKLSFNFYKKNATGDLMNRISEDVSQVRMYLGPGIMYTVDLFFLFGLLLYRMLSTNPELTLYVLLPLPLMSLLIYFVSSKLNRQSARVQKSQSRLSTIVQESFSGIRLIKSYAREKEAEKRFDKEAVNYQEESMGLARTNSFFMPTIILLIGISTILTIYVGGVQAQRGQINPGEIAEFVIYVNMLTWPFASVGWVTSIIQRAAASQERINEFLKEKPDIVSISTEPVTFEKTIEFSHVGITYENTGVTALNDVSFIVPKGKTIGVIGRTGAGKSSLAYLVMRLLDPTTGKILVDEKPLTAINLKSWRGKIGYVPQEHFLFSDSIKNNILFGLDAEIDSDKLSADQEAQMIKAAMDAGIHDSIITFPEGYDTLLGERGINLSGGQKQRVSIARALMKNPEILVLDDCLSAVDNETEEHILQALKKGLVNKTALIISHRISSIKYADSILVFEDGKIAESGTHDELLAKNGVYAEIHRKQQLQQDQQV
ncbi:MAG: ABC transporter ATP-binding protein [Bacteroidetes bacterium]|nr:ABC transporter ATP-binding protein [Bacteroidota bacterium]